MNESPLAQIQSDTPIFDGEDHDISDLYSSLQHITPDDIDDTQFRHINHDIDKAHIAPHITHANVTQFTENNINVSQLQQLDSQQLVVGTNENHVVDHVDHDTQGQEHQEQPVNGSELHQQQLQSTELQRQELRRHGLQVLHGSGLQEQVLNDHELQRHNLHDSELQGQELEEHVLHGRKLQEHELTGQGLQISDFDQQLITATFTDQDEALVSTSDFTGASAVSFLSSLDTHAVPVATQVTQQVSRLPGKQVPHAVVRQIGNQKITLKQFVPDAHTDSPNGMHTLVDVPQATQILDGGRPPSYVQVPVIGEQLTGYESLLPDSQLNIAAQPIVGKKGDSLPIQSSVSAELDITLSDLSPKGACDVLLVAGQDKSSYSAHSSILARRSLVLQKVLNQGPMPVHEGNKGVLRHRVMLNGYNTQDMEILLEFVYNRRNLKTRSPEQMTRLKVIALDLQLQSIEDLRNTMVKKLLAESRNLTASQDDTHVDNIDRGSYELVIDTGTENQETKNDVKVIKTEPVSAIRDRDDVIMMVDSDQISVDAQRRLGLLSDGNATGEHSKQNTFYKKTSSGILTCQKLSEVEPTSDLSVDGEPSDKERAASADEEELMSDEEVLDDGDEVVWIECKEDEHGDEICVEIERPTTKYVTQTGGVEVWLTDEEGQMSPEAEDNSSASKSYLYESHTGDMNIRRGRKPRVGGHTCDKCNKIFTTAAILHSHKRSAHQNCDSSKSFPCLDCPTEQRKVFTTKRAWLRHSRATHLQDMSYVCEQCGKIFYLQSELDRHINDMHTTPGFTCQQCGRVFTRLQALKQHADIHDPVPRYQCSECGQRFRTAATLRKHLQWHTGIRPHECPVCQRRFFRRNVMRAHLTIHTGTQPHVCVICDARFAFRDSLQRHERTHTNARYRCTVCKEKSFTRPYALKTHLLRTHNVKLESVTELQNNPNSYFIVTEPQNSAVKPAQNNGDFNVTSVLSNLAETFVQNQMEGTHAIQATQPVHVSQSVHTSQSVQASQSVQDAQAVTATDVANLTQLVNTTQTLNSTQTNDLGLVTLKSEELSDIVESLLPMTALDGDNSTLGDNVTSDHNNILRILNSTPKVITNCKTSNDLITDINFDNLQWNLQG